MPERVRVALIGAGRIGQRHAATLASLIPRAELAVIADVYKLKISTGAHWTYLADADLELQTTLDIREYTDPHHAANVPHTVILSPGLVIEKVYVGYWFWGRPSPYRLWDDLGELLVRTRSDFDPTTDEARAAFAAA